jgi:hypothetical protein
MLETKSQQSVDRRKKKFQRNNVLALGGIVVVGDGVQVAFVLVFATASPGAWVALRVWESWFALEA